jgi:hypothetical protein
MYSLPSQVAQETIFSSAVVAYDAKEEGKHPSIISILPSFE